MKTIKWGIIGAGRISSTFATALNSLENVKLMAVASRDINKSKDFAQRFHFEKAYGSYEELVNDPEIDVVYIGTPHTEHKENAALCLKNGKAVLCEKPFTLNEKESEYLIKLAKEHNVFLMEAMWTKFLPATMMVKKWIKENRIGKVKHLKISFGFYSEFDMNSRLFNPQLGGGALLDVGVYPITYAIHMLDSLPVQVLSNAEMGRSNIDEQNVILFKFGNGALAQLSSAVTADLGKDAVIIGDKGSIKVPNFWMADSAQLFDASGKLIDSFSKPHKANGYENEAEEVSQCIRDGKMESEGNPLQGTLDIIKIMDHIRADWGLVYPQER
ncbi:MAG TPA: Gfo/Idh/MocA family oxidoreductase [Mobilitalea sp.]|nr:Gfo/Idh/MocA family oxidoreductase [Mobilitalea sp.]